LRVALVGLGGAAAHGHLPALRRLEAQGCLRLVAVADPALEPCRRLFGSRSTGVSAFSSAEDMLEAVEADLLAIATEPAAHAQLVGLGLAAGVSIVCEKPLVHTEEDRAAVVAGIERFPELAVITVLQYRYLRTWRYLGSVLRRANALRAPFSMTVEVCRNGMEDPYAGSDWRADLEVSGGMLADHAPHYVALARTIDPKMSLLTASRFCDGSGRERSRAELRVGSGRLGLRLSTLAAARRTRLTVGVPGIAVGWERGRATLRLARRETVSWSADELSERPYLDSLYVPFYEELVRNLGDPIWRARRTAESLQVSKTVVEMLERVTALDSISA
jgi:hypothetical protein